MAEKQLAKKLRHCHPMYFVRSQTRHVHSKTRYFLGGISLIWRSDHNSQ